MCCSLELAEFKRHKMQNTTASRIPRYKETSCFKKRIRGCDLEKELVQHPAYITLWCSVKEKANICDSPSATVVGPVIRRAAAEASWWRSAAQWTTSEVSNSQKTDSYETCQIWTHLFQKAWVQYPHSLGEKRLKRPFSKVQKWLGDNRTAPASFKQDGPIRQALNAPAEVLKNRYEGPLDSLSWFTCADARHHAEGCLCLLPSLGLG